VCRISAALIILCALRFTLVPLAAGEANEEDGLDEDELEEA
jgi:hypothetical protein